MAARALWASRAASYLRISAFRRRFSSVSKDLKYADSHEWVKADGTSATIGITDHAQDHLGDVVYVELPEVGSEVTKGNSFGAVESVKASSDIYSPVTGKVVEVNDKLSESPGLREACLKTMAGAQVGKICSKEGSSPQALILNGAYMKRKVNGSPYDSGWIIKVEMSDPGEVNSLMDSERYTKFCEEEDAKH